MSADDRTVTLLVADADDRVDELRMLLRRLAETAASRGAGSAHRLPDGSGRRTWALLGEIPGGSDPDNQRVVDHDLIGRLAVRLAVDKIVCIGESRMVRALHQGAVMEGSWGDEASLQPDAAAAASLLRGEADWRPGPGDVVLIAGAHPGDELIGVLRDDLRLNIEWA